MGFSSHDQSRVERWGVDFSARSGFSNALFSLCRSAGLRLIGAAALMFLVAQVSSAQVTVGSTSSTASTGKVHSLTISSHSVNCSNSFLMVSVAIRGNDVSSAFNATVTYDGFSLTRVGDNFQLGSGNKNATRLQVFAFVPPNLPIAAGSGSIVATIEGASTNVAFMAVGAITFCGVRQSAPIRLQTCSGDNSGTSTVTLDLSGQDPPPGDELDFVVDYLATDDTANVSALSGQTVRFNMDTHGGANGIRSVAGTRQLAAGTTSATQQYDLNGLQPWSSCAFSLRSTSAVATLARVESFKAVRYADGPVIVQWRTGFEVDNLGFNLYREVDGQRGLVTPQLIAGSALLAGPGVALQSGRSYAWTDTLAPDGDVSYFLEDVDLAGLSTWTGPAAVEQTTDSSPDDSAGRGVLLNALASEEWSSETQPVWRSSKQRRVNSARLEIQAGILAASSSLKLLVKREGLHRITRDQLAAAGFNLAVDPRALQVYVDGREQPIKVVGEENGRVDAVEFYGVGIDSPFTDARAYWLVAGSRTGRRMTTTGAASAVSNKASFPYTVERRDRTVYFSSLRNGEAENFFGAVVTSRGVDQSIRVLNLDQSKAGKAVLEVALQGVTLRRHLVKISLNGTELAVANFYNQSRHVTTIPISNWQLREGDNRVRLVATGASPDVNLVDYIRLTYPHTLKAESNALRLVVPANQSVTISGFTTPVVRVLDVTDGKAPSELRVKVTSQPGGYSATLTPPGAGQRALLAAGADRVNQPAPVSASAASTLRSQRSADLIIIASGKLLQSFEPLAVLRRGEGLLAELIDVDDIYNEFSFGQKTPYAIRSFLSFTRAGWKKSPRFVLLAGDASFDPKNYLGNGDTDLVPSKLIDTALMETVSDDWLADFADNGLPAMLIGRLPVRTPQEAGRVVSKLVSYEQGLRDNRVLLVSDSGDTDFPFAAGTRVLQTLAPTEAQVEVIDRNQMDDNQTRSELLAALNRGPRLVNYSGHGSVDLWRAILTSSDAGGLTNANDLSLFVAMTCLNGHFGDPALDSLGEALLKSAGGAIAVFASSNLSDPGPHFLVDQATLRAVFESREPATLGEVAAKAKAATDSLDVRRTWILLGDPSMKSR